MSQGETANLVGHLTPHWVHAVMLFCQAAGPAGDDNSWNKKSLEYSGKTGLILS